MGAFQDPVGDYQKTLNKGFGSNYREAYFSKYPNGPYRCKGCGMTSSNKSDFDIDHIVPKNCGGSNALTNLQTLCRHCNRSKQDTLDMLAVKHSGQALLRELRRVIKYQGEGNTL